MSWTLTYEYKFNLNRPNLPNIYPFLGKANKSLIMRENQFSPDVDIYKPGELFRSDYRAVATHSAKIIRTAAEPAVRIVNRSAVVSTRFMIANQRISDQRKAGRLFYQPSGFLLSVDYP